MKNTFEISPPLSPPASCPQGNSSLKWWFVPQGGWVSDGGFSFLSFSIDISVWACVGLVTMTQGLCACVCEYKRSCMWTYFVNGCVYVNAGFPNSFIFLLLLSFPAFFLYTQVLTDYHQSNHVLFFLLVWDEKKREKRKNWVRERQPK